MTARLRFAPSPNGPLHLGHALSAFANEAIAVREGGELLLRIEDIDAARARPEHEAAIKADLAWLGLSWAGPIWRQSSRMAVYQAAFEALRQRGLLYRCYATRGEIRAALDGDPKRDPDGAPVYPGLHKDLSPTTRARFEADGRRPAWRLDMDAALRSLGGDRLTWMEEGCGPRGETGLVSADPAQWGDVILRRRDVPTSYHLSVVVDDGAQNISHVVRGRDLFYATSLHRLLQRLLALPEPRYVHHRLVLGHDGGKLSKSAGAPRLGAFRDAGITPAAIRNALLPEPVLAHLAGADAVIDVSAGEKGQP